MTCVDRTQPLPPPCEDPDEINSCIEFKWYVGKKVSTFDICEGIYDESFIVITVCFFSSIISLLIEWGTPCQKPIKGFIGQSCSNDCDHRAAIQSKITGITVCNVKSDGTEDDCTETAIMTANEGQYNCYRIVK